MSANEATPEAVEKAIRSRGLTGKMERVTVRLPHGDIDALDELVENGVYPNRSEAIRAAVREEVRRGGLDGD